MVLRKRKIKLFLIIIIFFIFFSINIKAEEFKGWIHLVDIAKPLKLTDIINRYSAYDKLDGNITGNIKFETTYDHKTCQIGEYELYVSITNSNNVTTTQIDKIIVRDFVCPTIDIDTSIITIDTETLLGPELLSNHLTYNDNLDTNIIKENIIIEGLSKNYLSEGTYSYIIYVLDSSTNKSNELEVTFEVIDNIINTILPLTIDLSEKYSDQQIIEIISQHTTIPKKYKDIKVESSYFYENIKPGIYPVKITIIHENDIKEIITFKINYIQSEKSSSNENLLLISGIILILIVSILIYKKRSKKS